MKSWMRELDPLRLVALALILAPVAVVFALGVVWLWQSGQRLPWMLGMAAVVAIGYALQHWLARRDRRLLGDTLTTADPDWPPSADAVWADVEAFADALEPAAWPLDEGARLLELGRRTLEKVSARYHPDVEQPMLELTVPHTLLIIERASRDLRKDVTERVPFSHRLTLGDVLRVKQWQDTARRVFDVYRAGRLVINPIDALIGEVKRHLLDGSAGLARDEFHRWLLHAYVRKVGFYAIDLYSGRLPLDDRDPVAEPTGASARDLRQTDHPTGTTADDGEPLRIVVSGRANAGKSSLINALFGKLTTPADVLADTTARVQPHLLRREGMTRALVFDTPGCDTALFDAEQLEALALEADLLLWVVPVNRPDRDNDRRLLDRLRGAWNARSSRRPPVVIIIASHIDQLRPAAEWQPPYDLDDDRQPKAVNIRAAVEAVARDLAVATDVVIPVCLAEGREYNVDDGLWSLLLEQQQSALRSRLLRCLESRRRNENWALLLTQLREAGRFLWNLPRR